MPDAAGDISTLIQKLVAEPHQPDDGLRLRLPAASGLYAWWAAPTVFPDLIGPVHPKRASPAAAVRRDRHEPPYAHHSEPFAP